VFFPGGHGPGRRTAVGHVVWHGERSDCGGEAPGLMICCFEMLKKDETSNLKNKDI